MAQVSEQVRVYTVCRGRLWACLTLTAMCNGLLVHVDLVLIQGVLIWVEMGVCDTVCVMLCTTGSMS